MFAMEYGKAFTFITDDPDWIKKFVLATVMVFVPVLGGFLLLGYSFEITRRVIKDESPALPDWGDFGDFLKKGFTALIVTFVYTLPISFISVCAQAPLIFISAAPPEDGTLQMVGAAVGVCFACVAAVVGIISGLLSPIALGRVADTGQLGAAFKFAELFKLLSAKPAIYLIIFAILAGCAFVLAPLGILVCFVGLFVVITYINLVAAHLYGQAYRVCKAESGLA